MGIVSSLQAQSNIVMKILLVLAVAAYAKAEAEADPGFVYSTGALPLAPALTYAYNPVVYTVPAAGCQNSEGAFVPCAQGNYFGYVPVAAAPAVEEAERKKREAEAEPEAEANPEADPWLCSIDLLLCSLHLLPCVQPLWTRPLRPCLLRK